MAPLELTSQLQSLPPILHVLHQNPMPGYSKGSRGLSVLPRVLSIFTENLISSGPLSRQCSNRCTIRAGRNLPDKEFRYLRTVIVTAAIHRGFRSELLGDRSPMTPCFNLPALGRRQSLYVVFDFAATCVFSKQSYGPFHCGPLGLPPRGWSPYRGTPSPEVTGLDCRVP